MKTIRTFLAALTLTSFGLARAAALEISSPDLYVNGMEGNDSAAGDRQHPLKTLSAAIARLPDPVTRRTTIAWIGGDETTTGGKEMAANCLELMRRMKPGVYVSIVGQTNRAGNFPAMAWEDGVAMVDVRDGHWQLETIRIGTATKRQRRGVMVAGPGCLGLKDVTFRTRSLTDAAIYAHRGGLVLLSGHIRLNEHLHDRADEETFAGIIATDHGVVRFAERGSGSLDIGNGSLSASYYGVIRLGCKTARITSWGEQSNCLAINNGGRIDLHNSTTHLCARRKENTPIGLEHDGHVLAEDAHIIIEGTNHNAIVLQKASTLTCNDVEIRGAYRNTLEAMSGSMFVGRFLTDVSGISANTGATIHLEAVQGQIIGPVTANAGGIISMPGGKVVSSR